MQFIHAISFKDHLIDKKDILLFKTDNNNAFGELSYLEGMHPYLDIKKNHREIINHLFNIYQGPLTAFFENSSDDIPLDFFDLPVPYQFLLEQMIISQIYISQSLKNKMINEVSFNSQLLFFTNNFNNVNEQLDFWKKMISDKVSPTIKVKVGLRPPSFEIELLQSFIHFSPNVLWRLDFNNRKVDPIPYVHFINKFFKNIDYLESPPNSLKSFNFPLAIDLGLDFDQSTLNILKKNLFLGKSVFDPYPSFKNLKGIVLKPSFLGLGAIIKLSKQFAMENITLTLSSSYESPLPLLLSLYSISLKLKAGQEYASLAAFGTWDYVLNQAEIFKKITLFTSLNNENIILPKIEFGHRIKLLY